VCGLVGPSSGKKGKGNHRTPVTAIKLMEQGGWIGGEGIGLRVRNIILSLL